MQNPASHGFVTAASRSPQRKAASVIAVGALHVALIAALVAGLKPPIFRGIPHSIDIIFRPETTAPPEPPPPPPVTMQEPTADPVLPPKWTTENPVTDRQITVTRVEHPPATTDPVGAIAATPAQSLGQTHTTPPYPPLSRRLGEEGKVGLHIRIASDGRVIDAIVVRSSGVERLDDAARQWVLAHWRYRPATREGRAVAAETEAVVVFDLKADSR